MKGNVLDGRNSLQTLKRNIYRTAVATFVILVVAEVLLRLFVISPTRAVPDDQLGWVFRGNSTIVRSSEGFARNHLNSLGLNDEELSATGGHWKVIALGDSYTGALQVPRASNFTSLAETFSPCLDVLNAGRAGATIVHYPVVLRRLMAESSFDNIVIVLTSGDIDDIRHAGFTVIYDDGDSGIERIVLEEEQMSKLRQLLAPILSHSSLATYLKNRIKQAAAEEPEPNKQTDKQDTPDPRPEREIAEAGKIFTFVFTQMKNLAPTSVLYIPSFDYLADRQTIETATSTYVSSVIRQAADNADVPFMRVDGLDDAYRKGGIPPNGFANGDIRRGHLNTIGHDVTARALIELLGDHCTT